MSDRKKKRTDFYVGQDVQDVALVNTPRKKKDEKKIVDEIVDEEQADSDVEMLPLSKLKTKKTPPKPKKYPKKELFRGVERKREQHQLLQQQLLQQQQPQQQQQQQNKSKSKSKTTTTITTLSSVSAPALPAAAASSSSFDPPEHIANMNVSFLDVFARMVMSLHC